MGVPAAPGYIESLDRGLRMLQVLGAGGKPMSLSEVAKAAGLVWATARRIPFTFQRGAFVDSDGRMFALTLRVLSLASAYLSSNQIVAVLQPMIDEVAIETREVCSLAIFDGEEAVFIARGSPARVFSAGIDIGYRLPAFCTPVGRVLLGRLPNQIPLEALRRAERVDVSERTVLDPDRLVAIIAEDRAKGYSSVDREAEPGFRSIAVPVRRYDGAAVAAINVGAHVDRVSLDEMVAQFLLPLKAAARAVQPLLMWDGLASAARRSHSHARIRRSFLL